MRWPEGPRRTWMGARRGSVLWREFGTEPATGQRTGRAAGRHKRVRERRIASHNLSRHILDRLCPCDTFATFAIPPFTDSRRLMTRIHTRVALAASTFAFLALPRADIFAQRVAGSNWTARYQGIVAEKGQKPDSMRMHELFALDWDYTNTQYPEAATAVGYKGQNGRWTDVSLDAIARRKQDRKSVV